MVLIPRERYNSDPVFHHLVDAIEACLHMAQFTPSDIRAAANLACINFEMRREEPRYSYPKDLQIEIEKQMDKENG